MFIISITLTVADGDNNDIYDIVCSSLTKENVHETVNSTYAN